MSDPSANRQATSVPRHAATVMLLREAGDAVEVLVIRRHENLAFMGGMWVFPGGTLCAADTSADALSCIAPASRARYVPLRDLHGNPLPESDSLGLALAAHRETFEETGVLLAADGNHCTDDLLIRAQEQRHAIASQPQLFARLLHENGLLLDLDKLVYWAHWITPVNVPRRFDTRFFAAPIPPRQTATIDTFEAVDHAWMNPAQLIAAAADGGMSISQPTLYNLMQLDASLRLHRSMRAMLSDAAARQVPPVLPILLREPNATVIVLPWDDEYQALAGTAARDDYPRALRELPSRMTSPR